MPGDTELRGSNPLAYGAEHFARLRRSIAILVLLSPITMLVCWLLNAAATNTPLLAFGRLRVFSGACLAVGAIFLCMRRATSPTTHGIFTIVLLTVTCWSLALLATPTLEGAIWMLPIILGVPLISAPFWIAKWRVFASCLLPYASGAIVVPHMETEGAVTVAYIALALLFTLMCFTVFVAMDRTRRASYKDRSQLYRDAHYDALTGLASRRRFQQLSVQALDGARTEAHPVCLVFFDLDHFKSVNDIYGHAAGDRALARVAEAMKLSSQPATIFGRFGGEEFVALLPNVALASATDFAKRLSRMIARTDMGGFTVTISAGVAESHPDEPLSVLMHRADEALLQAKRLGRDRVVAA